MNDTPLEWYETQEMTRRIEQGVLEPEKFCYWLQGFCYWLQGFCELNAAPPTQEQWDKIKAHLVMVFDMVVYEAKPATTMTTTLPTKDTPAVAPGKLPDAISSTWVKSDGPVVDTRPRMIC